MKNFNEALSKSLETAVSNGKVNRDRGRPWDESGSPIDDVRESIERAKKDAGIKPEE